jgi:hypothetical protein
MGITLFQWIGLLASLGVLCPLERLDMNPASPNCKIRWAEEGEEVPETAFFLLLTPDGRLTDIRGHEVREKDLESLMAEGFRSRSKASIKLVAEETTGRQLLEHTLDKLQRFAQPDVETVIVVFVPPSLSGKGSDGK